MKLVQQKKLHFQEGNSDKIYEVDLCEVGDNQYVVNFRYGRKGANLTEGSKTVFPVPLDKAQGIFNDLVKDKTKKGYQDVTGQTISGTELLSRPVDATTFTPEEARKRAILRRLQLAINTPASKVHKKWKVSRVVWRAGELAITAAVPLLIELSQKTKEEDTILQYCIAYALGCCADGENTAAVEQLMELRRGKDTNIVRRAATVSLLRIAKGGTRELLLQQLLSALPPAFQDQVAKGTKETLARLIQEQLGSSRAKRKHPAVYLEHLYYLQQAYPHVRQALLDTIKGLSFATGVFKPLRHILKAAQQWEDAQMHGILLYKIDKQPGTFTLSDRVYDAGRWVSAKDDIKKEDTIFAYSHRTRAYLVRHSARYLDKLVETNQTEVFVKTAVSLLCSYNDATDSIAPRTEKQWHYNKATGRWDATNKIYDSYAAYWLLNCLLYSHSSRYQAENTKWVCMNNYQPGEPAPAIREEAYQSTWDAMPLAYVHLLMEAKATPVIEFALRAFRQHPQYAALSARFTLREATRFLQSNTPALVLYGLDIARQLYNPAQPDAALIGVMLVNKNQSVRQQASQWISQNLNFFLQETEFVKNMLTHEAEDICEWMMGLMPQVCALLNAEKRQTLIARLLSYLIHTSNLSVHRIIALTDKVLLQYFAEELRTLSLEVIGDVLAHTATHIRYFAARLFLQHALSVDLIPFESLQMIIRSADADTQSIGDTLFSRLSDAKLWLYRESVYQWTLDANASIRQLGKRYLLKLIQSKTDLAAELVGRYVRVLLQKETWEGIHQETATTLDTVLQPYLYVIDRELIFRLLNSDHRPAQELACLLIERYIPAESLTLRSIIRFADNEILQVRQLAWRFFEQNIPRIKYEREEAMRLLDVNWDDSRAFAFGFFRQHFTDKDWTPTILVAICDSVREDVQALGRELVTRFFTTEHGEEYLLKLAQHPRPALQQYATNYLQQFASGNNANLQKLEPFFVTVLSQVNKARIAKDRVLAFLHQEAMQSEAAAAVATRVLNRISGTIAIEDKAQCIRYLRDIQVKYPHLETVVQIL